MAMSFSLKTIVASAMFGLAGFAIAHGNVTPQEVDTGNLPELGDEVRIENPLALIHLCRCRRANEVKYRWATYN